jgi:peptidoglycan/xylan/chitin deacetylase (PgdA/CDA1 family)
MNREVHVRICGGRPVRFRIPAAYPATHWSSRLLAAELGLSHVTIVRSGKKWNLQPWRSETFKFSTDPET